MGAPKGNQFAKGHAPGNAGRKSALEEKRDAEFVSEIWQVGRDLDELKSLLTPEKGKKVAARDVFAYMALTAMLPGHKETALMKLADKILPDKIDSDALRQGFGGLEEIFRSMLSKKDE